MLFPHAALITMVQVYDESTALVANNLQGEEDVPEATKAGLTPFLAAE